MQRFPGFGPLIVLHDSRLSIEFVSIPSVVSIEEGVVIFSSSIPIDWVTSITSIVEELVNSFSSEVGQSSEQEIGQLSAQYPYSFWFSMWFPLESTLVEHHLLESSSWSIGQPTKVNQVINSWFLIR